MKPTHYEIVAEGIAYSYPPGRSDLAPSVYQAVGLLDEILEIGKKYLRYKGDYTSGKDIGQVLECDTPGLMKELEGHRYEVVMKAFWITMFGDGGSSILNTMMLYKQFGRKTFNLSKNLVTMLHDTDISGTYEFLKLPYEVFYLNMDYCPIHVAHDEGSSEVFGVYVSRKQDKLVFTVVGDLAWSSSYVAIDDCDPLAPVRMEDFNNGNQKTYNPAVELAVKALLYLNSESPDVKPGGDEYKRTAEKIKKAKEKKKVERLKSYLDTLSSTEYFDVGRSIKIKKQEHEPSRVEYDGGFHYSYKFWVRGHFRKQVCGKGRSERKLKWIEPYLKGPDQAAVVHRQYDVG